MSNNLKNIINKSCPELTNFIDNLRKIGNCIEAIAKPYLLALQKIVETPEFKAFIESLKLTQVLYKAEDKYWIIDDIDLLKILGTANEEDYSQKITEYYSKNNYENISKLLDSWKRIECISERLPIVEDCYKVMQALDENKIINNTVIPALLAQITGITEDLHALVPKEDKEELKKELTKNDNSPTNGEVTTEYLWRLERKKEVFFCYNAIFNAVMKNTKNKDVFAQEELEKYNKYRNKILHGDIAFINYGTDENLIRTWLELNILITVYSIYKNYKHKEPDDE